jgi:hypothetical protein
MIKDYHINIYSEEDAGHSSSFNFAGARSRLRGRAGDPCITNSALL